MLNNKKIVVILPAYNAAKTLRLTINAIPKGVVDDIVLVDDASRDDTVKVAKELGLKYVFAHDKNRGYGANQKTCYREALKLGADIIIMVHPDFQYDPALVTELAKPIAYGAADAVFGSRMLISQNALKGGMPYWKFAANIGLTMLENFVLGINLSEYHSGFRAYSRKVFENLLFELNSDDFVFDTEIIVQSKVAGFKIAEVPIPTRYFPEASMIGFWRSVIYGLNILLVMGKYLLHKSRIRKFAQLHPKIKTSAVHCFNCGGNNAYLAFPATIDLKPVFRQGRYAITDADGADHGNIYKCLSCGVYFVDRNEIAEEFSRYYKAQPLDLVYLNDEFGRRKAFKKTVHRIKSFVDNASGGARVLDVGCGPGFFLSEAKKAGFEIFGIEPSPESCEFARVSLKLENISCVFMEDANKIFPESSFEVIVAFDVIEHVLNPRNLFEFAYAKLKPGGILAITVPMIDSLTARILGKNWHAFLPSHLNYFTADSLEKLWQLVGFELARRRHLTRYLSLSYLMSRLFKKNLKLHKFLNVTLPINLFDEEEFYLRKK
ncbi:MAG: hypothetical protein A3A16_02855 [Candidatus Harrisonbacteria bacterium RIFCSPLOWO2_01_FULL_44_18]|uniref:Glycosyltransferase 2-like domain-containing protein n=1 Tax=Candidatus Harrisonbacteria bacterium RIFCSPLOWO2_01_FULL_44_18 TaxID=1798407 RepID=A0A1G1ZLA2_9BACT|nr:MAG: hypothetical protein A3A16_02855 [Candidatus Harrisonbacteria bacterium RIFCSPLOWO2_01_FULL_44_18]